MKPLNRRILLALVLSISAVGTANAAGQGATVDGIDIHYGVMPAEVVTRPTEKHDPKMHARRLAPAGSHHLVVAVSDAKTGKRIEDANVIATVTPLGMGPTEKRLEPMRINDTVTYGNFFDFPASSAPFKIGVKITSPSIPANKAVAADFEFTPAISR